LPKEIKLVTATVKGQNPKVILECADKHLIGLAATKPMRCLSAHSRITFGFCPFSVAVTNLISLGNSNEMLCEYPNESSSICPLAAARKPTPTNSCSVL